MKVVFLSTSGMLGGAERALLTAITSLQTNAQMRLVLLALSDGPLIALARQRGIDAHAMPMPPRVAQLGESAARVRGKLTGAALLAAKVVACAPSAARYVRALRERIDEINPELIHGTGIKAQLFASRVSGGRPVVWHVQDFLSGRKLLVPALRWGARRATMAMAASRAVANDLERVLPGLPVRVIPNAVDPHFLRPISSPGADLDRAAGLAPLASGPLRVGLVATYARWKGHDVFLRAAATLIRERRDLPAARFYIIGGPIYQTSGSQFSEAELRGLARDLGIDAHVGFVPFCPDTRPIYAALDVCVHASVAPEPYGLTIAEAMACGRPVISTDGVDIFENQQEGIRVDRGSAPALADAIDRLLRDPARRARIAAAGRRAAMERLGPQHMGEALMQLYRSVVADHGRTPACTQTPAITTSAGECV